MSDFLLTGTRKVVNEVALNKLDRAITTFLKSKNYSEKNFDKYGYESVAENEWSNDQSHTFYVTPEVPIDNDIGRMSTRTILNWMCAENLMEQGDYLVDVSW